MSLSLHLPHCLYVCVWVCGCVGVSVCECVGMGIGGEEEERYVTITCIYVGVWVWWACEWVWACERSGAVTTCTQETDFLCQT